jgi:succinoglycan biosynthesis protein ExoL
MQVTYFANDLADMAVARRVHMLQVGGASVTLIGFRRTEQSVHQVAGANAIDLGQTFDARFLDRTGKILRRSLQDRRWKDLIERSNFLLARNLEMGVLADFARISASGHTRIATGTQHSVGVASLVGAKLRWLSVPLVF